MNGQTTRFTWDDEDRLASTILPDGHTDGNTYTGLGMRLTKTDGGVSYAYLCDGVSPASSVLSDGLLSFTPGTSQTLGTPNGSGGLNYASHFYAVDGLGNLRGMSDGGGQGFPDAYNWDGFGQLIGRAGGTSTPFGYGEASGYQADGDSGLRLLGHRYYDSRTGRFISQDPIRAGKNWYSYCGNNPINHTDKLGLLADPFTMTGNPSPAEAEAMTRLNGGQDGESYDVTFGGKLQYSFTLSGSGHSLNTGWGLGLGIASEFIFGTNNHNRNYGPTSTQARNFIDSAGYRDMLSQIAAGQTSGGVGTPMAAVYSLYQYTNGTQFQLGAFAWQFSDPNNSNKGVDILNDITFNSLAYHIPGMLNNLGVPNPKAYLEMLSGGSPTGQFATEWSSGNFGTIHQKIHINFP